MYTPHEIRDESLLESLIESMTANGWIGAPLVGDTISGQLLTGSHRYVAAREAGIEAPIIDVRDVFAEAGMEYDEIIAEIAAEADYLSEWGMIELAVTDLPESICTKYGIDIH